MYVYRYTYLIPIHKYIIYIFYYRLFSFGARVAVRPHRVCVPFTYNERPLSHIKQSQLRLLARPLSKKSLMISSSRSLASRGKHRSRGNDRKRDSRVLIAKEREKYLFFFQNYLYFYYMYAHTVTISVHVHRCIYIYMNLRNAG